MGKIKFGYSDEKDQMYLVDKKGTKYHIPNADMTYLVQKWINGKEYPDIGEVHNRDIFDPADERVLFRVSCERINYPFKKN